jgi:N-acetylglucosamine-6-phosphate deacetylase
MKTHALVGNVLAPEPLGRSAVIIEDGRISDVLRSPGPAQLPGERREVSGFICPGFIDLQINGAFGINVAPDPEALRALARELPRTGTTSFLPTLISSPPEVYSGFLDALEDAWRTSGSRILGAHLEGPFLSPARKGAHDPANLRPVDLGLVKDFVRSGVVRMVTFAPELSDAREAVRLFLEGGITSSAGHTDATYEEILSAMDSGLRVGTHLYNAMSPFAHRAPGAVGALLADDRARAGIIFDGVHAHEGALRVAYRQKGPEGLALVTDAMEAAGMPSGEYELNDRKVRLDGGAVRLPDGTLAGSVLTMDVAVHNAVWMLNIPLHDAVRMATQTPAEILGISGKGRIIPGADADLVVLGQEGRIEETIIGGESVYHREEML